MRLATRAPRPTRASRASAVLRPLALALALGGACVLATASRVAAQGATRPRPSRADVARIVDSAAAAFVSSGQVPSVSVAVVRGRDTLVMRAYGLADVENDVAATPAHVYRIGSITKQFTSAAVMRLVEQGKVSLDDDITKYVTFDTHGRAVPIRRLLDHTSGIRSYTSVGPRWARRWREDMVPDTIMALVAADSFDFEPGTQWRYNNSGYVLLGMLIEKVTGTPYAKHLEDEFFTPLGLTSTSYCETRPLIKRRARGYDRTPAGFVNAEYLSMSQPYAAGSLCSTTGDLAKWNDALVRGRVVKPASYAMMAGPSTQKDGTPIANGYGFGLGMGKFGARRAISHSGGIHGFASDMAWMPDDSVLVVALTNAGSPAAGRLIRLAAAAALGDPLPGSALVMLTDADRARYAGEYRLTRPNGSTLDIRIWNEGGQLRVHPAGQTQSSLVPQGDHTFVDASNSEIRVRFGMEAGKATKLTLLQGGGSFEAPRIK